MITIDGCLLHRWIILHFFAIATSCYFSLWIAISESSTEAEGEQVAQDNQTLAGQPAADVCTQLLKSMMNIAIAMS